MSTYQPISEQQFFFTDTLSVDEQLARLDVFGRPSFNFEHDFENNEPKSPVSPRAGFLFEDDEFNYSPSKAQQVDLSRHRKGTNSTDASNQEQSPDLFCEDIPYRFEIFEMFNKNIDCAAVSNKVDVELEEVLGQKSKRL